jgi:hypothetical protein
METLRKLSSAPMCPNGHGPMERQSHWTERMSTYVAVEVILLIFGLVTAVGREYFAAVVTAMLILSLGIFLERWLTPCQCERCGLVLSRFGATARRHDGPA